MKTLGFVIELNVPRTSATTPDLAVSTVLALEPLVYTPRHS